MKILHVIAGIDRTSGGPTYAILNILKAEQALGYVNEVVTLQSANMEPEVLNQSRVHVLSRSFPRRYSRSREANRWLRENVKRFDVVHIHGIWSFLSLECARICRKHGVRYIFHGHGSLDPVDLRKKYWVKEVIGHTYYRSLFSKASAFFCTADTEADNLVTYGAKTKRLVVPLTVDYCDRNGNRQTFRKKYRIKEDSFVFLFLSRIDYIKGLDLLVPAFSEILTDFPNSRFIIAGSDSRGYESRIRKLVSKFQLSERLIFTGLLEGQNKADAFAGADLFVLPSKKENFGIAVVEALQSGLPVLISNNVYIHDQILRLNGGWVCDYSVESLHSVMRHILENKTEYLLKKRYARVAGEHFRSRNFADVYKRFYELVLSSAKPPHSLASSREVLKKAQIGSSSQ